MISSVWPLLIFVCIKYVCITMYVYCIYFIAPQNTNDKATKKGNLKFGLIACVMNMLKV